MLSYHSTTTLWTPASRVREVAVRPLNTPSVQLLISRSPSTQTRIPLLELAVTLSCAALASVTSWRNRAEKLSEGISLLGEPEPQFSLIEESQPTTAGAPDRVLLAKKLTFHGVEPVQFGSAGGVGGSEPPLTGVATRLVIDDHGMPEVLPLLTRVREPHRGRPSGA